MRFASWDDEWQLTKIGSVCTFLKGSVLSKANISEKGQPCILYGQLYTTYFSEEITEVFSNTTHIDNRIERSEKGDVIIPCSGETPEDIATARCVMLPNVLYGGDLNVLRTTGHNGTFLSFQLNGKRRMEIAKIAVGKTIVHLHASDLKKLKIWLPQSTKEEEKIASFLSTINKRIMVQNKIIEELFSLEESIINAVFSQQENGVLSDFIEETSNRNKGNEPLTVFSVSNKLGFIPQSEQFEEKEVASANKRNYKVVSPSSFAYNPARINVGSIGFYSGDTPVIISPMYVCFRARNIDPTILTLFFKSKAFFREMSSKLEGSVRQCLTFQGMKSIKLHVPNVEDVHWLTIAKAIREKRMTEEEILQNYLIQKQFLLVNMFI